MRRIRLMGRVLAVLAMALVSAACGTSTAKPLQDQALSLRDLPAGWQTNTGPYASPPACFAPATPVKGETMVRVRFKRGTDYVDEALRRYPGDGATVAYDDGARTLAACHAVSIDADGVTYTGQLTPVALPRLADQSGAYRLALHTTSGGIVYSYAIDLVFARKGQTEVGLEYTSGGVVSSAQLQALAAKAVAKLS